MRVEAKEVNVAEEKQVPSSGWIARIYLWACERLYAELAGWYDVVSWVVSLGYWRSWQAHVWGEVRGHDVLDVGSGTGALIEDGAKRGFAMVGVDRSPRMVLQARRRLGRMRLCAHVVQGDGRTLCFANGTFDTVTATFPAGYILEEATLAELRRVLQDSGRLVILGLWVELHMGLFGRLLPVFYGRPTLIRLNAIALRVEQAGFRAHWVEQRTGKFIVGTLVANKGVVTDGGV